MVKVFFSRSTRGAEGKGLYPIHSVCMMLLLRHMHGEDAMRGFCCIILLLLSSASYAKDAVTPLPVWLSKMLTAQKNAEYPDIFEEAAYDGKRVFHILHTSHPDRGDEHVLLNEEGKEICQFGGYAGRVTSGSCDMDKIKYIRTLH